MVDVASRGIHAVVVRVQCPQCQSYCQVQQQHVGATVKCGKCGQPFVAQTADGPKPAPPPPPVIEIPPDAIETTPAAAPSRSAAAAPNLWSGLRGLVKSIAAPPAPAPVTPPPPATDPTLEADDEVGLELDGLPPPPPPPPPSVRVVRYDVGCATSAGKVRTRNEDSYLAQQLSWSNLDQRHELAFIVVADGMGGYEAGDKASNMVIRHLAAAVAPMVAQIIAADAPPAPESLADPLLAAIKAVNRAVQERGQSETGCKGMGATVAVVLLLDGHAAIAHVGDCRVYHQRGLDLTQVTKDQTLVARMVEMGKLTPAEALTHPMRNEVTQAIGKNPDIHPASYTLKVNAGDWLVIACDGLHAHVEAPQLNDAIRAADAAAGFLAQQLVDLADQGGGSDNCTVVAVRCY